MPVLSSRRYGTGTSSSSSYLSSNNYHSSYSTLSSTSASTNSSSGRYSYGVGSDSPSSYRSSYRSSYSSGSSTLGRDSGLGSSSYRNYDDTKSSLSTRIGVSNDSDTSLYRSRYNRISVDKDTKKPPISSLRSISSSLPPPSPYLTKRSSISRESTQQHTDGDGALSKSDSNHRASSSTPRSSSVTKTTNLANDLDSMYEKYSPSRYRTKYEQSRTVSLSDAAPAKSKDDYDSSANKSSTYTPKSEIRSVAIRNALPSTSSISSRSWDYPSTSSSLSSLYSSRSLNNDSGSKLSEKKSSLLDNDHSTKNGLLSSSSGYRSSLTANSTSPSKSPIRDSTAERKAQVEGLCGLWNIGNTCFMNSVLQCLSHTADLTKFVRSDTATSSSILNTSTSTSTAKDIKIWTEFVKLINQMWTTSTRSVNPSDLKMALSSKHRMYIGSAQQDAQEFLRYFLDALHGALNKGGKKATLTINDNMSDLEKAHEMWDWYTKREDSFIKDLFVGQLKSSLYCFHCEKTSVMYDPFWDMNVPLPSSSVCKLTDCLDLYTAKDVMDGDEMPYCDFCKTRRKCSKGFTIQRFPKYLVIHLKRFSEMRWTKMTNVVEFPTGVGELDLSAYASDSMDATEPKPIYSLYAVSNHMGSTHGGHYLGLAKHPITKKWHEFNDNFVSETRESSLVSSSAYLLFYERV